MRRRWIIGGVTIAVMFAGYSVYWHRVADVFEQNLALWPEQWRASDYRVDLERSPVTGFPWLLRSRVDKLEVQSPPGPDSWVISKRHGAVFLMGKPWRPFGFNIELQRQQEWAIANNAGGELLRLSVDGGGARFGLSFAGLLDQVAFHSLHNFIQCRNLPAIQVETIRGTFDFAEPSSPASDAADIGIKLSLDDILIDQSTGLPLGNRITRLIAEGFLTGRIPPGPTAGALAQWRDGGGVAEITTLVVNWGPLALTADATIALDKNLQPLIAGTAVVRGYDETVDAMVAGGLMSQSQGATARIALAAMAQTDEGGKRVRLPITIQDGFLFLGPLKIAAVPPIDWKMKGR